VLARSVLTAALTQKPQARSATLPDPRISRPTTGLLLLGRRHPETAAPSQSARVALVWRRSSSPRRLAAVEDPCLPPEFTGDDLDRVARRVTDVELLDSVLRRGVLLNLNAERLKVDAPG
jgi:hypothetical protein